MCVCVCLCVGWCSKPVHSSWAACLCSSGSLWSWGSTQPWLTYFRDSFRRIPGSTTFSVPPTVSSVHRSITDDTRRTRLPARWTKTGLKMASVFQYSGEMDLCWYFIQKHTHTHLIWAIWDCDTAALVVEERPRSVRELFLFTAVHRRASVL